MSIKKSPSNEVASRTRLRGFVDLYHGRDDPAWIPDFPVSAHARSTDDAAREVLARAGWLRGPEV